MIPVRLQIQGFLSYRAPVELSFEDLHLACISGANGAGKSSILDAITWVLFGIARARSDAVINQSSESAEIIFDFDYENQRFRIQRARALNKSQILEFFTYDAAGERWRPLTEHTVSETQARIHQTLRMDYDTFINAAFFLQGKADQFTQLSAGQRKEILSNILGLEVWETYRADARERRRSQEIEHNRLEGVLAEIASELAKEPAVLASLAQLTEQRDARADLRDRQAENLEQARQLEHARNNAKQQLSDLEDDLREKKEQLQQRRLKFDQISRERQELQEQVANAAEIQEDFRTWQGLRQQLDGLEDKAARFYRLNESLVTARQSIRQEEVRLQTRFNQLEAENQKVDQLKKEFPDLESRQQNLQTKIQQLEDATAQREDLENEAQTIRKEITEHQTHLKQLNLQNGELREHLKAFRSAGPTCPFCSQPLTEDHRKKYEDHVTEEGVQRKQEIENRNAEIARLETRLKKIQTDLQALDQAENERQQAKRDLIQIQTRLEHQHSELDTWQKEKSAEYRQIKQQLAEDLFALEERKVLAEIEPQVLAFEYDQDAHEQLKQQELAMRGSQDRLRELERAQSSLTPLARQLTELNEELENLEKERIARASRLEQAREEFDRIYANTPDLDSLQRALDEAQIEISSLDRRIGAEKQQLSFIEQKKKDQDQYKQELDHLTLKIARFKRLEEAFGKNGIPALLIEQALPEIETHANELLDRLSTGTMSVRFETQSEYKDKKRQDKKETLDILINDANGNTRAYEMFSGGEAFRINFSIRLALSQVLAKRSGARLQTLVIDEGFGSQDAEGRQRLIEAINQVQDDFARILVITHLEELKDAFPARIEVEKTLEGSRANVVVF